MFVTALSRIVLIATLLFALFFVAITSVSVGATEIGIERVLSVVAHALSWDIGQISEIDYKIITDIRAPRVFLVMATGAGLGICGLVTQTLLRNPLGDPYLLGISQGASAGAAMMIFLGSLGINVAMMGLSLGAFVGALLAIFLVTALASLGGPITTTRIIFAGMATSYLFGALTSLIILLAKNSSGIKSLTFWMLGSFSAATWSDAGLASLVVSVVFVIFLFLSRRVDLLGLGDDVARSLGTSPALYRNSLFAIIACCVAVLVSIAGPISFVGLVVPHFARLLVGGTTRVALPVVALCGMLLLMLSDIGARYVIRPAEMPIGIITALVGTPVLIWLIRKYSH